MLKGALFLKIKLYLSLLLNTSTCYLISEVDVVNGIGRYLNTRNQFLFLKVHDIRKQNVCIVTLFICANMLVFFVSKESQLSKRFSVSKTKTTFISYN